jgi:hypothetical protein
MRFGKELIAQGMIEYLVILAVVVISLVVGLFTGIFSNSSKEVIASSSKVGTVTSGGISVIESVIDPSGDALIKLSNMSIDTVTLNRISVGSVDNNYSTQLVGFDSKTFSLSNLNLGCPCQVGQESVKCELENSNKF